MKQIIILGLSAIIAASCAKRPNDINASYVSSTKYSNLGCNQIQMKTSETLEEYSALATAQNSKADKDVAFAWFLPVGILVSGEDNEANIAHLKGEIKSLENASSAKNCGIQFPTI